MSYIRRWRPLGTFPSLAQFPFEAWFDLEPRAWGENEDSPARLGIDVSRNDDSYVVEASLPGISADKIDAQIDDNVLKIKGSVEKEDEREKDGDYVIRERYSGSFYRALRLPDDVDSDKAETRFENGVLSVTIPRRDGNGTKRLEIKAG